MLRCRWNVVGVADSKGEELFLGDSGNEIGLLCDWSRRRRIIN